jgi:hypothetical protein
MNGNTEKITIKQKNEAKHWVKKLQQQATRTTKTAQQRLETIKRRVSR